MHRLDLLRPCSRRRSVSAVAALVAALVAGTLATVAVGNVLPDHTPSRLGALDLARLDDEDLHDAMWSAFWEDAGEASSPTMLDRYTAAIRAYVAT